VSTDQAQGATLMSRAVNKQPSSTKEMGVIGLRTAVNIME
jgi:hypothetical protein